MTRFKNVETLTGERIDVQCGTSEDECDGSHLIKLPAIIDPHVHFRVPGAEYKEDWGTVAKGCVQRGVTTVFDMPNNTPACTTLEAVLAKKATIDSQLKEAKVNLRYHLYLGADRNHLEEIDRAKDEVVAIKVFMGSSTGTLLIDDDATLDEIFKRAAAVGKVVAVHAEDEEYLAKVAKDYSGAMDASAHSRLRPKEAAILSVTKAIGFAKKHGTSLYILHVSTAEEIELIRQAKEEGVAVFCEVTMNHLFLDQGAYDQFGTLVQVNPPLRTKKDREALWAAIADGTVDTVATDHAPHTLEEKKRPFGQAPSGIPGVETLSLLMLDAVAKGRLTFARFVELTRTNIEKLFGLEPNDDFILVDRELTRELKLSDLTSKAGYSPYVGRRLQGWPICTLFSPKRAVQREDKLGNQRECVCTNVAAD